MSETQDGSTIPEGTEAGMLQQQLSRRAVLRAGLVVVPVLMTLPVVPAWARQAGHHVTTPQSSTYSRARCDPASPQYKGPTSSCHPASGMRANGAGAIQNADPFGSSPFSTSPFDSPTKPK